MEKGTAVEVLKRLEEQGYGRIYRAYSGRFMFGATCIGFYTDRPMQVAKEAAQLGFAKIDQLGKGSIVYWPRVED